MKYELQYRDKSVGNVDVNKIGLYYEIECRFQENRKRRFRLVAVSSHGEADLGECRFTDGYFRMARYLPIRSVGHELLRFYIIRIEDTQHSYTVFCDRPFPFIDKLEKATLMIVNGEKRIKI